VKTKLAAAVNAVLEPMRERGAAVMSAAERIREIAVEDRARARGMAQQTMERVRDAVRLDTDAWENHEGPFGVPPRSTRSALVWCLMNHTSTESGNQPRVALT